jgi:hypothetical protein
MLEFAGGGTHRVEGLTDVSETRYNNESLLVTQSGGP